MKTKDVRDALQLSTLVTSIEDVTKTARTIMKYRPKEEDDEEYEEVKEE
jgi:hypothetical protein